MRFLHEADIVHRDIKPSNIFITKNCEVKIGDFGIARTIEKDMNKRRAISPHVITRNYRPPEVALKEKYDQSADIWSLGCVLYTMMASSVEGSKK